MKNGPRAHARQPVIIRDLNRASAARISKYCWREEREACQWIIRTHVFSLALHCRRWCTLLADDGRCMKMFGVDPGLSITGYACVEVADGRSEARDVALVEAGVIRLRRGASVADRLVELERDLHDALERLTPDSVAVEAIFSHYRRPRTAIIMGHARGVILLAAARAALPIHELSATTVKRSLTGNGHASKMQMQQAVQAQLRLDTLPTPPDVADAIAIALTAVRRRAAQLIGT